MVIDVVNVNGGGLAADRNGVIEEVSLDSGLKFRLYVVHGKGSVIREARSTVRVAVCPLGWVTTSSEDTPAEWVDEELTSSGP